MKKSFIYGCFCIITILVFIASFLSPRVVQAQAGTTEIEITGTPTDTPIEIPTIEPTVAVTSTQTELLTTLASSTPTTESLLTTLTATQTLSTMIPTLTLTPTEIFTPTIEPTTTDGLFLDMVTSTAKDQVVDPTIVRTRNVGIKFSKLTDSAPSETLILNLFDDVTYTASLIRIENLGDDSYAWIGVLNDVEYSGVIIIVNKTQNIVTANISMPGGFYQIRYVEDGVFAINQIDQSKFPPDDAPMKEHEHEEIQAPKIDLNTDPSINQNADVRNTADDGSIIKVLVVYSAAARSTAGGTSAMQSLINLAVTETNQSYANSGITQRLTLAHADEVVYDETGFNWDVALDRVLNGSDGYMDNVQTLRETYKADLVMFIAETDHAYCGLAASILGGESYAYAITARNCATGYYSFGHELGHLMGARHDWYVDSTDNSPYTYNHGYVSPDDSWRTIMAYGDDCDGCTRIQYWSNPDLTHGGYALGIAEGNYHAADNRKTLNNTAFSVANFRADPLGAATLIAPTGTITSSKPTFIWSKVPSSVYYRLWVKDASNNWIIQDLYTSSNVCGSTNCAVVSPKTLANGSYTWYIQTLTATQNGSWSGFTMTVSTAPLGASTLVAPKGSITSGKPTFVWSKVANSTLYRLWVKNSAGLWVIQDLYTASNVCGATNCAVVSPKTLANGSYTWYIQTLTATQNGSWSGQPITISQPVPGASTLIAPKGTTTAPMPTFVWSKVSSSTYYRLWIKDSGGNWVIQDIYYTTNVCGATNCAVQISKPLPNGAYTWYIQTLTATQNGTWSGQPFTLSNTGFATNFNSGMDGWGVISGNWWNEANSYMTTAGISEAWSSIYYPAVYTNLSYTVNVSRNNVDPGAATQIIIRGQPTPSASDYDWYSGYEFGFNAYGSFCVWKGTAGSWTSLQDWTYTSAINQGAANNVVKIVANGSSLAYYINGILVWSGTDSSISSGYVGIAQYVKASDNSFRLWTDWAMLSSLPADLNPSANKISPEQLKLNQDANNNNKNSSSVKSHQ